MEEKMRCLREAMKEMYRKTDEELLRRCGIEQKHYASSTSVTLVLWQVFIKKIRISKHCSSPDSSGSELESEFSSS